ncbi:hypothetical protein LFML04_0576 [Leptospirillum ferriphilum ML-04]|uniref:Uncharacterized protein n=1 Tax=Leptospirillum ferriphilum (strain ML-04) TaxID=1048260 RepID=J9ZAW1_LEPFM|nr:hypothetical protein LFML04_0576 [Leptospirillum ferriphilum ML-04]
MNRNSIITDFLNENNIKHRFSGKFLRFPAIWRGGNGLNVSLDTETGRWTDFAGGEKGNFASLAAKIGISTDTPVFFERDPRAARREKARLVAMLRIADRIWKDATSITPESPSALYLRRRGIPEETIIRLSETEIVREARHGDDFALVTRMYDGIEPDADFAGIHRIFIDKTGAPVEVDGARKMMLGGSGWTVIPGSGEKIVAVGEGLETCLSAWSALDRRPGLIVSYVAGNLEKTQLSDTHRSAQVLILADRDLSRGIEKQGWRQGRGQEAAGTLAKTLVNRGFSVSVALPPGPGKQDWNDIPTDDAASLLKAALETTVGAEILPIGQVEASGQPWTPVTFYSKDQAQERLKEIYETPGKHLVAITTGVGKTKIWADSLTRETPTLTVFPDLDKARDFAKESGAKVYFGRSEQEGPGQCLKYPDLQDLGEKRRSIMAHECQTCPHGLSAQSQRGSETARETAEIAGLDLRVIQPCDWIFQISEIALEPHVACTEAALQGKPDHLLFCENPLAISKKERRLKRKIVFDDCFVPMDEIKSGISLEDVAIWLQQIDKEREKKTSTWLEKIETALRSFPSIIQYGMSRRVMLSSIRPPDGFQDWSEFAAFINDGKDSEKVLDGLSPERVTVVGGRRLVPLRALLDLARAVNSGTVYAENGLLHGTFDSLSAQLLREKGRDVVILDATPTPERIKAVREAKGQVHELFVQQPRLHVTQFTGRLHGRSSLSSITSEIRHARRMIEEAKIRGYSPSEIAFLTHLPLAEKLRQDRAFYGVDIGHFGRDQRSHNAWKGKKLLISFGIPLRPDLRTVYQHCTGQYWTGDREFMSTHIPHRIGDQVAQLSGCKLPVSEEIRDWERTLATAEIVQAIGRLRAVHAESDVEAWVVTSYPLAPAFGLQIDEIRREGGRTAGEYQDARWADTVSRFDEARGQGAESFRQINTILKKLGKLGISSASYQKLRSRIESFDMSMDGIDAEELESSIRALLNCENPVVEAKNLLKMENPRTEWVIAALTVIDVIESETQSQSLPKTG